MKEQDEYSAKGDRSGWRAWIGCFIERVKDNNKEDAQALLNECFSKQDSGEFDLKYLEEIKPRFFAIVKPEAVGELTEAMGHFASRLQ